MVRKVKMAGAKAGVKKEVTLGLDPQVVSQRVQRGCELTAVIKDLDAELKVIKAGLMLHAKETGTIEFSSESGDRLTITPSSKTTVSSVKDFVRLLQKLDKSYMINDLLKVEITKVKKILGEDVLEEISETKTEKFGKMSFKISGDSLSEIRRSSILS